MLTCLIIYYLFCFKSVLIFCLLNYKLLFLLNQTVQNCNITLICTICCYALQGGENNSEIIKNFSTLLPQDYSWYSDLCQIDDLFLIYTEEDNLMALCTWAVLLRHPSILKLCLCFQYVIRYSCLKFFHVPSLACILSINLNWSLV